MCVCTSVCSNKLYIIFQFAGQTFANFTCKNKLVIKGMVTNKIFLVINPNYLSSLDL